MKSTRHIFEQKHETYIHPDNSPLFMPDVTNRDESLYQTVRGVVCNNVLQDQIVENIELVHEKSKTNTDNYQVPPNVTLIISNKVFYIQTPIEKLNNNIDSLLSSVAFQYEYKNRYSWFISYSNLQDNVSFNLNIYLTEISDVFLFEFQYQEGDKVLYSEIFKFLYKRARRLNILCDENGNLITLEEKETDLIDVIEKEKKEIPKLLNEHIQRYIKVLQSPYYETVKEELKSLIFFCSSEENRIVLLNSGIFSIISLLKGKDKEINRLVSQVEDLVGSSCIEL